MHGNMNIDQVRYTRPFGLIIQVPGGNSSSSARSADAALVPTRSSWIVWRRPEPKSLVLLRFGYGERDRVR